ncbi:proline-rich protein 22-like [Gavia stellata]|uniref:proline-rich protein 22-like n=1 Tax=Gavia stellata TaxID=37040 RepID=UPI0028A07391|nr:proline-rich protein 22-like [Gavia stellata]
MARPPLRLPARGPQAPPAPWLLQPFVLPKTFYPRGSPNLCQLPGQEQLFPAVWAPPVGVAPQAPQAPPAAPQSPQGQPQHLPPYTQQGRAVTPAPPLLPTSIPGYQQIQGQPAETKTSGSATPRAAPPGNNIPLGSDVPPSPSAAPHEQALGDPTGDLAVAEEVLLEEALRLFGCSPDAVGVSQDAPSSGPRPGDPGGTGAAIPHCDFASLSLPEELLSPDYSVPETADAILSLDEFVMGLEPQEPWGDEGRDLPPSQPATAEKRGKKRAKSTSPKPASKHRALAGSRGVAGRVNSTAQFGSVSKLANGAFTSRIQTMDQNSEQHRP